MADGLTCNFDAAVLHEERDGLQVQVRGVLTSSSAAHVVVMRTLGTGELHSEQGAPIERLTATGTRVAVGVEGPLEPGEEDRQPRYVQCCHATVRQVRQSTHGRPRGLSVCRRLLFPCYGGSRHEGRPPRGRRLSHALSLDTVQVGSSLLDGLF